MKHSLVVSCFFVCATIGLSQAQNAMKAASAAPAQSAAAPAAAQTKDPVTAGLRLILQRFQNNTIGAIDAMPADKFSYKPTADQVTFAHLAAHIANSNNLFCSKAADVPAPKVDDAKETDSKDQLVAAVKASFSFCSDALAKMDDSKLGDTVELFPGRQLPRSVAALGIASSMADHYGAAAMYLRLNNILPPSAQPKK